MRRLLLPAVLAFAAVAVPARAASVSSSLSWVYYPGGKGFRDMTVTTRHLAVAAAPGEGNAVSVSAGAGVVVVRDACGCGDAGERQRPIEGRVRSAAARASTPDHPDFSRAAQR